MRRTPYTARGIRRVKCMRCGAPSTQQWQICADGNQYRGICTPCDVALNAVVLRFLNHPQAETLLQSYRERHGVL